MPERIPVMERKIKHLRWYAVSITVFLLASQIVFGLFITSFNQKINGTKASLGEEIQSISAELESLRKVTIGNSTEIDAIRTRSYSFESKLYKIEKSQQEADEDRADLWKEIASLAAITIAYHDMIGDLMSLFGAQERLNQAVEKFCVSTRLK